ncbi:uncharacterized protein LOC130903650 [Diorhabda carinulata]|nr:uncharacterized protein LOC130903650 [Diorhabda carinulata]
MITPAGHVDYYPDGGEKQWGCYLLSCSHMRACDLFIASVRKPDLFKAYSYESWLKYMNNTSPYLEAYPMGIAASPEIPNGIYFLEVYDTYKPYVFSETTIKDSFDGYFEQMLEHLIG